LGSYAGLWDQPLPPTPSPFLLIFCFLFPLSPSIILTFSLLHIYGAKLRRPKAKAVMLQLPQSFHLLDTSLIIRQLHINKAQYNFKRFVNMPNSNKFARKTNKLILGFLKAQHWFISDYAENLFPKHLQPNQLKKGHT